MTRADSLVTALAADSGVTALVGDRIYPLNSIAPDGSNMVIYKFKANYEYITLAGFGTVNVELEIRSWAKLYRTANAIAAAVQAVLMPAGQAKGFSGLLGGAGGIKVIQCRIQEDDDRMVALSPNVFAFESWVIYALKYSL